MSACSVKARRKERAAETQREKLLCTVDGLTSSEIGRNRRVGIFRFDLAERLIDAMIPLGRKCVQEARPLFRR